MPTRKSNGGTLSSLGRAIIKSRERQPTARKSKKASDDSQGSGYVSSKSKDKMAKSIVEENDLDEFLAKADLAGTNFEAEHMNIKFISVDDNKMIDVGKKNELRTIEKAQEKLKDRLRIPRRPQWSTEMSANDLQTSENRSFLEWRRDLAALEQEEHVILTPFERNLEVWRQLWRVVERSDIVVQIVDARNPLLFRCRDLESYAKEVGADKVNFVLVNKADLLAPKQRQEWARYFRAEGIRATFWSAATVDDDWSQQSTAESSASTASEKNEEVSADVDDNGESAEDVEQAAESESDGEEWDSVQDSQSSDEGEAGAKSADRRNCREDSQNQTIGLADDGRLMNRAQLLDCIKSLRPDKIDQKLTVGMVGYPNVGKSSTINKLIGQKKVAVSATPGKTKHFQTLFVDDKLCLCDCPGLVMPSFVISKEEMIVNGILPCDEMRDYTPAVGLICSRIDRQTFERVYSVMLPKPGEYEAPGRKPTPREVLTAYAFLRGFMSSKGIPDSSRAARIIIKDYVIGRLRYCHAPPGVDQASFDDCPENEEVPTATGESRNEVLAVLQRRHLLDEKPKTADIDRTFFKDASGSAHVKTAKKAGPASDKKHHHNRNKKEKLRRVYAYLDA